MNKIISVLFVLFILQIPSYSTDISCSFTERNADYNIITGQGMINYNGVLFSIDDKTKTVTHSYNKTPLEVLSYTNEFIKFKMNINTEDSENNYIITINRLNGAIKTEHHRILRIKTYNPLSQYLKNAPKYETHVSETDFYGNGTCLKYTKSTAKKF